MFPMQPPQPPPFQQPPPMHPFTQPKPSSKSRKRGSIMDFEPDVIEIPPALMMPSSNNRRSSNKHKQAIQDEVIDVDDDEDFSDHMILDENVDSKKKGKAVEKDFHGRFVAKDAAADHNSCPFKGSASGSHNPIIIDDADFGIFDDDDFMDSYSDESTNFDDYAYLQAHFDDMDIPAGVEAPVPNFLGPVNVKRKTVMKNYSLDTGIKSTLNNPSSLKKMINKMAGSTRHTNISQLSSAITSNVAVPRRSINHASTPDLSFNLSSSKGSQSKSKPVPPKNRRGSSNQPTLHEKVVTFPSTSSANFNPVFPSSEAASPFASEPAHWGPHYHPTPPNYAGWVPHSPWTSGGFLYPVPSDSTLSGPPPKFTNISTNHSIHQNFYDPFYGAQNIPEESAERMPLNVNIDDVLLKYHNFKRFDTVEDHSDHWHSRSPPVRQPSKKWAKKIQEEWRILENDLPDTIFVRAYESRMELLRAVIIGAEGTPYHDGLFFFDISFPSLYPDVPPEVYYHSGGLRLNPNLYSSGKVCLSLLGTWHGNRNEQWLPGVSTVLQVLVSIQALILNQKPFFNEPGYENMSGSARGERESQEYNEKTFTLSLKTMAYSMRRPPKHFKDFVLGHFHKHADDILVACKAYWDGAQVGCLVKGGVQDVDEGDKSCSRSFRDLLPKCIELLLKEFSLIGIKDTEKYKILTKRNYSQQQNIPRKDPMPNFYHST